MKNAIIFGANSEIAIATIDILLKHSYRLVLLARDIQKLNMELQHFNVKYPNSIIACIKYDATQDIKDDDFDKITKLLNNNIDLLLIAHGVLPDEKICINSWIETKQLLQINSNSILQICHYFANLFEKQKYGTIAVISSVAGDRVRQSNYIYGTSKAVLNAYLSGLRNRMNKYNVNVLTILPGFVRTKMTDKFSGRNGFLWASPKKIAQDIFKAINNKSNILYTPFFWRYIMFIIKHIPEFIFKKMKL
jgi:decaprenylphospho-beta-D-erythro-pentofuranosid-2-ulose 2-reductase